MKFMTVLLVSLFSIANLPSAKQNAQGTVAFSIKKGFSTVKGEFKKSDYSIELNDKNGLESIRGTADILSVATNSTARDKHLQNKEWFNSEEHPQIIIQSQKITMKKEGEYVGLFEIKIKGKTQTKEIPFQVVSNGSKKNLKATFILSIGAFDIGGGMVNFLVGDKVTVNLDLPV